MAKMVDRTKPLNDDEFLAYMKGCSHEAMEVLWQVSDMAAVQYEFIEDGQHDNGLPWLEGWKSA